MEGGVLIVGVTDEIPRKIIGLDDLENKMKYSKDVTQRGINYPRDLTHFHVLSLDYESGHEKLYLLIIVKRAMNSVGVNNERVVDNGTIGTIITPTYPIRNETGITRVSLSDIKDSKMHLKHDSYNFLSTLETNHP